MPSFARRIAGLTGAVVVGSAGALVAIPSLSRRSFADGPPLPTERPTTRADAVASLRHTTPQQPLDLLIIGGGATGAGVALDAATRGLRTGVVEMSDFGAGTSSRSTKLIHGGVRYLEKAVFHLDLQQLQLVFEALAERAILVHQAPHLCSPIPTMLPCYKWWEVPWYLAGLKMYDLLAALGRGTLELSHPLTAAATQRLFGELRTSGPQGTLAGSIVYYDGQMNDARLCLSAILTASCYGATAANYCKVIGLEPSGTDGVQRVHIEDRLTRSKFSVFARAVVNATGPFSDSVAALAETEQREGQSSGALKKGVAPSRGSHLTLPAKYSPEGHALLIPKTSDGRVVFLIRWLDRTIAGTTDVAADVCENPQPSAEEIAFILDSIQPYVGDVDHSEILSAWAGLRPLTAPPSSTDSQEVVREHFITIDAPRRMLTVTGGKWTTYRKMGEDIVDRVVANFVPEKADKRCVTSDVQLLGGRGFDSAGGAPVDAPVEMWTHLRRTYGTRARDVLSLASASPTGMCRLAPSLPVIEAEVEYAALNEMCETVEDFVCRRTRMAYLDAAETKQAIPRIAALLAAHKKLPPSAAADAARAIDCFLPPKPAARSGV